MLHENKYQEMHQVHDDPRGFGMTSRELMTANDSYHTRIKDICWKSGEYHWKCSGKNNREEFLPFSTYPFGLVNE